MVEVFKYKELNNMLCFVRKKSLKPLLCITPKKRDS